MNDLQEQHSKPIAHWRIILAAVLDFLTAFFLFGYLVGYATGNNRSVDGGAGFNLNGWPAVALFILIVAYFWIGRKYLGGTLWQRILKAR